MNYLLRRRKLGNTSCRGISAKSLSGLSVFRNDAVLPEAEYVFRWGCTSNVNSRFVVNKAEAIHRVSDKRGFRAMLDNEELCPATWGSVDEFIFREGSKYIVRPAQHAQGRNVLLCNTREEIEAHARRFGEGNYYISDYIQKDSEYRICVVQGRVAWIAKKTPANPDDVAWNVARGGRFDNINWDQWPLKACRIAVQATLLSGLDFGGVDIMMKGNECYVLEINSAPSLTSEYRQQCMAKCFDWIVRNGKDTIPLRQGTGDWKKWGHPALDERIDGQVL